MTKTEILKHRLERLEERADLLKQEYTGRETEFTFWAGWELGYCLGKISGLEEMLDTETLPTEVSETKVNTVPEIPFGLTVSLLEREYCLSDPSRKYTKEKQISGDVLYHSEYVRWLEEKITTIQWLEEKMKNIKAV